MKLGENFSGAEKLEFVERHLLPDNIIKLFCHMTTRLKEKRLVIVIINPELLLFSIKHPNRNKLDFVNLEPL